MTNGIAVSLGNPVGRDYWINNTCCSGYSGYKDGMGSVLRHCLESFISEGKEWIDCDKECWEEWSPMYTLAVPEQLVWWEDE